MSNEAIAQDFMLVIGKRLPQFHKTLTLLAYQYAYQDEEGLDDIIQDTILKCHQTIVKKGFEGNAYVAYFQLSLERAFIKHIKKEDKKPRFHANTTLSTREHDQEEYFVPKLRNDFNPLWVEILARTEESDTQDQYDQELLREAFDALPLKFQEVLNMRVDGMRYRQIYRILNLKPSCLKLRIRSARIALLKKYNMIKDGKTGKENGKTQKSQ